MIAPRWGNDSAIYQAVHVRLRPYETALVLAPTGMAKMIIGQRRSVQWQLRLDALPIVHGPRATGPQAWMRAGQRVAWADIRHNGRVVGTVVVGQDARPYLLSAQDWVLYGSLLGFGIAPALVRRGSPSRDGSPVRCTASPPRQPAAFGGPRP